MRSRLLGSFRTIPHIPAAQPFGRTDSASKKTDEHAILSLF